jgi:transposase
MAELVAARSWLNPVEAVWSNLKISLANLTKQNIGQLTALVKTRPRRMQYRPSLLAATGRPVRPVRD